MCSSDLQHNKTVCMPYRSFDFQYHSRRRHVCSRPYCSAFPPERCAYPFREPLEPLLSQSLPKPAGRTSPQKRRKKKPLRPRRMCTIPLYTKLRFNQAFRQFKPDTVKFWGKNLCFFLRSQRFSTVSGQSFIILTKPDGSPRAACLSRVFPREQRLL